jgi:hypothetical protein
VNEPFPLMLDREGYYNIFCSSIFFLTNAYHRGP